MGKFWSQLTGLARALIVLIVVGSLVGAIWHFKPEWLSRVTGQSSQEVTGLKLDPANVGNKTEAAATLKPVFTPEQVRAENAGTLRYLGIAWNGQIGLLYANGGKTSQAGSIMQLYGVGLSIARQDDYGVMQGELLKFAQAYAAGDRDPSVGVHALAIMGDANPGFLAGLQTQLDNLTKDSDRKLHAKVIGAPGRSFGEDKCMGPAAWADDPKKALGGVIAGVLRDGDIHICLAWAQQNGIKVNPDPKTWDPEALNFYATSSFNEADQAYITGKCESRPVMKNGKGTGSTQNVCVAGTATWTPGDVNVMRSKGGIVSLLSTRENGAQMYATIIVIDEWARENPATVTNFLKGAFDGSAEVSRDRVKLRQAAAISAIVWGEQDADYWEKYYYGRTEDAPNTGGRQIRLGGSQALGIASNVEYFLPAGSSVFNTVYTMFGDLDQKLYPDVMPSYPKDVVDTFFIEKIQAAVGDVGKGSTFGTFTGAESQQVANRSYAIQFAQGSATILPSSADDLNQILSNVTLGSELAIEVNGYTSSEGEAGMNDVISVQRANAVRAWLVQHARSGVISPERIRSNGYGETNLKLDSSGKENRAASRRVEIRLLGNGQ